MGGLSSFKPVICCSSTSAKRVQCGNMALTTCGKSPNQIAFDTKQRSVWQGDNNAMDVVHMDQGFYFARHVLDFVLGTPGVSVLGLP